MEEVDVADDKVDADGCAKPSETHDRDNFNEAAGQVRASGDEKQQAAHGTEAAAEASAVVRYNRDELGRDVSESGWVEPDESQVRWHKYRCHAKDGDRQARQDEADRAGTEHDSSPFCGAVLLRGMREGKPERAWMRTGSPNSGNEHWKEKKCCDAMP